METPCIDDESNKIFTSKLLNVAIIPIKLLEINIVDTR